jgi:MFS family permease
MGVKATKGVPLLSAVSALRRPSVPVPRRPVDVVRHPVSALTGSRALAPFAVPAFRSYATGQAVASFGTWIQNITQDWLVLMLTHSAQAVGLIAAFQFLPALLLGSCGGAVADRFPRHRLLMCTQLLNCAVAAVTAVLALTGQITVSEVYVLALVAGLVWVIDNPTRQALLGDLVPPDRLRSAVSVNASIFQSARIVAPALAGVLITAVGPGLTFGVDTACFAVGLLAWSRVRVTGSRARRPERGARVGEAFAYLRRRPHIGLTIGLVGVVGTFGLNFPIVLTVIAERDYRGTAALYGLFNVMLAIGSVAGALVAAGRTRARLRHIVALGVAFGAAQLLAAVVTGRGAFLVLLVVLGFANLAFQAIANSAVQLWTEPGLRGRVLGLYGQVFVGGTPIGAPLIGALTARCGGRVGMAVCGGLPLAAAVVLGAALALREARRPRPARIS